LQALDVQDWWWWEAMLKMGLGGLCGSIKLRLQATSSSHLPVLESQKEKPHLSNQTKSIHQNITMKPKNKLVAVYVDRTHDLQISMIVD
jgi:hypothetical protein